MLAALPPSDADRMLDANALTAPETIAELGAHRAGKLVGVRKVLES